MALWKKVSSRDDLQCHMKAHYDKHGIFEIRAYYADWIEERMMSEKAPPNQFEQTAINFLEDLKKLICNTPNDPLTKVPLNEFFTKLTQISPIDFYTILRNGIQTELQIAEMAFKNDMSQCPELFQIFNRIDKLDKGVLEYLGPQVQTFRIEAQQLSLLINEFNQLPQQHPHLPTMEQKIKDTYNHVFACKVNIINILKNIIDEYRILQSEVIDTELKKWARNQALSGNGATPKDNLDYIQRAIERLIEIISKVSNCIAEMTTATSNSIHFGENPELLAYGTELRLLKQCLICSAFIVEKQPPQVMKTNTRFAATVRWLIGPQLGVNLNSPTVECMILSEAQAQRHVTQQQMSDAIPSSSGDITSNIGTMEYQPTTRHFSANFRNMQLKKIKRAEKKGTESVMDEKFALLFHTATFLNDYKVNVWTLSLPVVVIVHGNQEPQSWATITWDNAFSEIVREPFVVPERVCWTQLSYALNTKFGSATGRTLSEENLQFLYEKVFRGGIMSDEKDYITWAQFCKEPIPDRTFTFWEWFFAIMKLTKDHLLGPWKAGRIIGFINKRKTTDEILRQYAAGTFLLRFSDSELGGITVAFVDEHGNVLMLQPWTAKDLNVRGLPDRIEDLEILKYVYPNVPKDEAFAGFCTPAQEQQAIRDGYVRNIIRAHVPGIEPTNTANSTPQHMQSPNPRDISLLSSNDSIMYAENTIGFDVDGMSLFSSM